MKLIETELAGAFILEPEPHHDERGFFARTFCREELRRHGLVGELSQASLSFNRARGTLRGMHYQVAPHEETKLVSCVAGAVHDVLLDLRPSSATFGRSCAVELSAENLRAAYVPAGFAHGFLTLCDGAMVSYLISAAYVPEAARGVRFDDPRFAIEWPFGPVVVSERDRNYPDYRP